MHHCTNTATMEKFYFVLNVQKPRWFTSVFMVWLCFTLSSKAIGDVKTLPVRDTVYGKIQGYVHRLKDGRKVERYLGIPYAAPPVGERRFALPVPPSRWPDIIETTRVSSACMQHLLDTAYIKEHAPDYNNHMSEDCLYLNVYVPRRQGLGNGSSSSSLSVLIHVHGGSNEVGMGAMFHGDILASYGEIIVVTLNYRLGAFGFLRIPKFDIPGNFGLHDQLMAFRWVSENIVNFGGDPSRVTIQGHSAGSIDVALHVLSPMSKGLFRYAILQSGAPIAYWSIIPDAAHDERNKGALHHLTDLGCSFHEKEKALSCLRSVNVTRISTKIFHHGDGFYIFSPSVDRHFVVEHPRETLVKISKGVRGILNVESLMTGVVKDEGSLTAQLMVRNEMISRYRDITEDYDPKDAFETFEDQLLKNVPSSIANLYQNAANFQELSSFMYKPWEDPSNLTAAYMALSDLVGDTTFTAPTIQMADYLSAANSTDIYVYRFDHRSSKAVVPEWMGVPHGEDLFYLFGCPIEGHQKQNYTALDRKVSLAVIQFWANFVKLGRPYLSHEPSTFNVYGQDKQYISISSNETDVVVTDKRRMRARFMAYWNYLLPFLSTRSTIADVSHGSKQEIVMWILAAALCISLLVSMVAILILCCNKSKTQNVKQEQGNKVNF